MFNKKILFALAVLSFVLIAVITFYFAGLKKYGTPSEYREKQSNIMKAREDSLRSLGAMTPTENVADSTLFGMSIYAKILEETLRKEEELKNLQTMIDSLRKVKTTLEEKEKDIEAKQEDLQIGIELLQDENAAKMAKLYDNMKTQSAVQLFIEMPDTLAVKIISRMQPRNAAKLLGAIGDKDVEKAARLNKILSMDEVVD